MGKTFDSITDAIAEFITEQQMFFVATAGAAETETVNVSPKGLDSFLILDSHTVVYADLIGSGIETVAHVQQNGRITIMFCAFSGAPKIVRLHGRGEAIIREHTDFDSIAERFPPYTGLRCFIRVHCERISDSCGFGVPVYEYKGQRNQLTDWAERKKLESLDEYVHKNNRHSIDGIPGMRAD